jgi:hypothetical protein
MPLFREEEARFQDSLLACPFPGCLRSFRTDLGLKKHSNLLHPNWIFEDDAESEEGQSWLGMNVP